MRIKIQNKDHFAEHDLKFVQFLELDEEFEAEIERLREKWGIPKKGLNNNTSVKLWRDTNPPSKLKYQTNVMDDAIMLATLFRKPKYWAKTFLSILLYNTAIPHNRTFSIFQPVTITKKNEAVIITVREKISIKQLKKYITDNTCRLNAYLSSLPANPYIKATNIKIKKRIARLKRQKKTDAEIGSIILKEFPKGHTFDNTNYEVIGVKRNRFQKVFIKNIKKDFVKARRQEELDNMSEIEKYRLKLQRRPK